MSFDTSLVRADRINKSYEGVRALRDVSFELWAGEVHALVGENGAGKSTLIKTITGAIRPDKGTIFVRDQPVHDHSPRRAKELGIAAIYQQPALFPALSVSENLALGLEEQTFWTRVHWPARRKRARKLLARVGANIAPEAEAGTLSMPEQQLVEIARAIGADARVLIMDEPTASLSDRETDNLYGVIRQLRQQGVGIIYISHRLEELTKIADRVTVLRDGQVIETRSMAGIRREELIRLMVGRELATVFPKRATAPSNVALELRNLSCETAGVRNVDLTVRAGEIVGLAGLVGSGRTELARTIFGLTPADSGEIRLKGKAIEIGNAADAIASGLAYVPEDRRKHGVIPELPISCNVTLAILSRLSRGGSIDFAQETRIASEYLRRLRIKAPSLHTSVGTLSGGNQQKVALSRWLAANPSVLILDEPTQGIDIGAKAEIHALIGDLAAQGMAVLMISSELPEILGMSDRIAVMHAGRVVGVLDRAEATQEKILNLALGHSAQNDPLLREPSQ
ncbi:MAG TPA: sugar ABC transporter ATP-binding protein [Terriglobales bacterium]|nr:sugar ABC transporter ATP-binding protein [Terriglobales bacterium]